MVLLLSPFPINRDKEIVYYIDYFLVGKCWQIGRNPMQVLTICFLRVGSSYGHPSHYSICRHLFLFTHHVIILLQPHHLLDVIHGRPCRRRLCTHICFTCSKKRSTSGSWTLEPTHGTTTTHAKTGKGCEDPPDWFEYDIVHRIEWQGKISQHRPPCQEEPWP